MKIKLIAAISALLLATSCMSITETRSQHIFSSEKLKDTKLEGEACAHLTLGVFYFGDMSVDKAAKQAGITEVTFVENKITTYPFVTTICTIVKGR